MSEHVQPLYVVPLLHENVQSHKGAAKRRNKLSSGMKGKNFFSMWVCPDICETFASKMKPASHA